ncbi:MAG: CCA tRNA nucleotidyltransferase [Acidobacteria bacterium]|nr:CCA tRNA nucleotidyltransferase [Acidobacteriota bacterium]
MTKSSERYPADARRQAATNIVRRLRKAGFAAYLVGGCVRDILMGREPNDYDVATDATPADVVKLFPASLTVGAQFGVVIVPREEGNVEVATFRSDGRYTDGRHPVEVRYSKSAEEDVRRRDFTINGLLYDPLSDQVLDYVGGQADIHGRKIRTIGDPYQRFSEDRLRMLRAVRFAARFDFALDPVSIEAIRMFAGEIRLVSAERIRDEILKILTEGRARQGFELLDTTGLLREVLPEVKAMQGIEQPPEFHPEGDVWTHTLMMLEGLHSPTPALALGVLLHDVGKPPTFRVTERIRFDNHVEVGAKMAEEICTRFRLSSRDTERVAELVRHHLRFKDFPRMRRSTQIRFLRMQGFEEHLELHRLDCLASHGMLDNYYMARRMLEEMPPQEIKPPRLLTGHDLVRAGYRPGPEFKTILQAVEDAQLEGQIRTKEDALHLVRGNFPLVDT